VSLKPVHGSRVLRCVETTFLRRREQVLFAQLLGVRLAVAARMEAGQALENLPGIEELLIEDLAVLRAYLERRSPPENQVWSHRRKRGSRRRQPQLIN
jgi:hypothetical protein